jgi:hypothetical protein
MSYTGQEWADAPSSSLFRANLSDANQELSQLADAPSRITLGIQHCIGIG